MVQNVLNLTKKAVIFKYCKEWAPQQGESIVYLTEFSKQNKEYVVLLCELAANMYDSSRSLKIVFE